ncbi:MAG: sigma-70 family RNA polymerase sigma factor [Acidobacteriaceae bacterium]|nr:sigma-70 family RNA polymerase sigma factor [Acidobacteriaceae bacterium]
MDLRSRGEITRLLAEMEARKEDAAPRLFELLYDELRRLAQHHLANEREDHTLQATALVHEAWLKLSDRGRTWQNRAHFFAAASSAIRRILVDYARAKHAAKRPGSQEKVRLDDAAFVSDEQFENMIDIDRALTRLGAIDARQSRIVELRYFGGLTAEETAQLLDISVNTVQRDWSVARAWLHGELARKSAAG